MDFDKIIYNIPENGSIGVSYKKTGYPLLIITDIVELVEYNRIKDTITVKVNSDCFNKVNEHFVSAIRDNMNIWPFKDIHQIGYSQIVNEDGYLTIKLDDVRIYNCHKELTNKLRLDNTNSIKLAVQIKELVIDNDIIIPIIKIHQMLLS